MNLGITHVYVIDRCLAELAATLLVARVLQHAITVEGRPREMSRYKQLIVNE